MTSTFEVVPEGDRLAVQGPGRAEPKDKLMASEYRVLADEIRESER